MCLLEFLTTVSRSYFELNHQHECVDIDCVFFCSVGNGGWVSLGVRTTNVTREGNTTSVQCEATHLTSFAVLVDVSGGQQVLSFVCVCDMLVSVCVHACLRACVYVCVSALGLFVCVCATLGLIFY